MDKEFGFAFPPFNLVCRVLRKVQEERVDHLIKVTPTWQSQSWYSQLLMMPMTNPALLFSTFSDVYTETIIAPQTKILLVNPQGQQHSVA